MKVYMVVRRKAKDQRGDERPFATHEWSDNCVFLQKEDAIERAVKLKGDHKLYCERYNLTEYLDFEYTELELKGSWVDV